MQPTSPIYTRPRSKSLNGYSESRESESTIRIRTEMETSTSTSTRMWTSMRIKSSARLFSNFLDLFSPPRAIDQSSRQVRGNSILVLKPFSADRNPVMVAPWGIRTLLRLCLALTSWFAGMHAEGVMFRLFGWNLKECTRYKLQSTSMYTCISK